MKKIIIFVITMAIIVTGCSMSTNSITCKQTFEKKEGTTKNSYTIKFKNNKVSYYESESTIDINKDNYDSEDEYKKAVDYYYNNVKDTFLEEKDKGYEFDIKKSTNNKIKYTLKLDIEKKEELIDMSIFKMLGLNINSQKTDVKMAYENLGYTCK